MANAALLYQNLADAGVITASSSIISAPPSVLQNAHVARHWRSTSNTGEHILIDLGSAQSIDTIALFGTTLTAAAVTRVRVSSVDTSGQDGDLFDSGSVSTDVFEDYDTLIRLLAAPVSGRYVRIDMTDATLDYLEAGRLAVGLREAMEINFAPNWSRGYVDRSRRTESRGGQTYIDPDVSYRTVELAFEWIEEDQRNGLIEALDRINGANKDILFVTDPDSDNLGRDSIWGLVDGVTPVFEPVITLPRVYSKSFKIAERL